jgi:hypothetical protein
MYMKDEQIEDILDTSDSDNWFPFFRDDVIP